MRPPHRGIAAFALAAALLLGGAGRVAAADELLLGGGRFRVEARWQTAAGAQGTGHAIRHSSETGFFWFFSPANLELVVKVIDACESYDRFWVFASGLTHTAVTLTVEDTWTGERQTYEHPGGTLYQPFADTGSFGVCDTAPPGCGSGKPVDVAASPRADVSVEALALVIGDRVVAEQALYERLRADLASIRHLDPQLAGEEFHNIWWDTQSLLVDLTQEAYDAVRFGTFHGWDCLNDLYGATVDHVFQYSTTVLLRFEPMLHAHRLGNEYRQLDTVLSTSPNHYDWPSAGTQPTPGLCANREGEAIEYFFEGRPWRHYVVPAGGAAPVFVGSWDGQAPQPSWHDRLADCYGELEDSIAPGQPSTGD
jgi:hypothetical protein